MPHGAPDWNKYRRDSVTFPIDDLAEHAARLGSISIFDRRGDVVLLDDFQDGIRPWSSTLAGTGAAFSLSPDHFLSCGHALSATCPSDNGFDIILQRYIPYTPHAPIGLELAFTLATYITAFRVDLAIYDGQNLTHALLRYVHATNRLQYFDSIGAYIDLTPTITLRSDSRVFNHIKLVVDPTTPVYVRAILNHQSYPMTNILAYSTPTPTTPVLIMQATFIGTAAHNPTAYLDNVIITQDEP